MNEALHLLKEIKTTTVIKVEKLDLKDAVLVLL